MNRLLAAIRRANAPGPSEDDPLLRLAVLVTTLVAFAAVATQQAVAWGSVALAAAVTTSASIFSYRMRRRSLMSLKAVLALVLTVLFLQFLAAVRFAVSVDQTSQPLTRLFVYVVALHSCDLPRRRDLAFSLAATAALMAVAGVFSVEGGFGIWVLVYAVLLLASLALLHASEARENAGVDAGKAQTGRSGRTRVGRTTGAFATRLSAAVPPLRAAGGTVLPLVLAALAVFAFLPRFSGMNIRRMPMALGGALPAPGPEGTLFNPRLGDPGPSGMRPFNPGAYFGFDDKLDLRVRGRLSEELVMRVRAPEPHFWRALAFDTYDGTSWTASDRRTHRVGGAPPIGLPAEEPGQSVWPSHEVVQTFFLESAQPNVVFAAYQASELYFPTSSVRIDRYGSLLSPVLLEAGTVYSVVSRTPTATPDELRSASGEYPEGLIERYTALPPGLPERVRSLALATTATAPTNYDKILALESWIGANTRYDLTIGALPSGADAVDNFLFGDRHGYCEQIASALAIMARTAGIPTRMAVGFTPGTRDAFGGMFEVRANDAHSWVEVFFPEIGWYEFDPTHEVPEAVGAGRGIFRPLETLRSVAATLASALPAPARLGLLGLAGLIAAGTGARSLGRGLRARAARPKPRNDPAARVARCFEDLTRHFADNGIPREPWDTPREWHGRLRRLWLGPLPEAVDRLMGMYEAVRFAGHRPAEAEAAQAEKLLAMARAPGGGKGASAARPRGRNA